MFELCEPKGKLDELSLLRLLLIDREIQKRREHAAGKCQTTVQEYLDLTQAEAKEQRAAIKAAKAQGTAGAKRAKPEAKKDDSDDDPEPSTTGTKRKKKVTRRATPDPSKKARKK